MAEKKVGKWSKEIETDNEAHCFPNGLPQHLKDYSPPTPPLRE
jgi:hypothetical protein